jgi:hypothetical protein
MFSNQQPYPVYKDPPREPFSIAGQQLVATDISDLQNLETPHENHTPLAHAESVEPDFEVSIIPEANKTQLGDEQDDEDDSDLEEDSPDSSPPETETLSDVVDRVEKDGELNARDFNPADLPSTYRIPTTVPGFNSLFDIHNDPDCCSSKSQPRSSKKCYTREVRENHLKKMGKKHKPLLQKSTCAGDDHDIDPAGILCYSKEPPAIPIEYFPNSCLPPQLSKNILNKNDCFNPSNLVYTPDPVDPIDYTVRKGILNPLDNTDTYVQAVVDPTTNRGFAMDFR